MFTGQDPKILEESLRVITDGWVIGLVHGADTRFLLNCSQVTICLNQLFKMQLISLTFKDRRRHSSNIETSSCLLKILCSTGSFTPLWCSSEDILTGCTSLTTVSSRQQKTKHIFQICRHFQLDRILIGHMKNE